MTEMLPHAWDTQGGLLSFTFIPDNSTAVMRPREDRTFGDHFWSGQSSGSFLEWTIFWIILITYQ